MASALRERTGAPRVAAALHTMLRDGLVRSLTGEAPGHLCIVLDGSAHSHGNGAAMRRLPQRLHARLGILLAEWAGRALVESLPQQTQRLVAATEEDADGITVFITLEAPPGFPELRAAMAGGLVDTTARWEPEGAPAARLDIVPGFYRA
jgi:hypothetical protein